MKSTAGTESCPFGQAPIFKVGDFHISQMDAITRYIARAHNLYGATQQDAALIDMVLIGVESIRSEYTKLIYEKQLSPEGLEAHKALVLAQEGLNGRNGGAHFGYLNNILQRNGGGEGFVVGASVSIADIQLFDVVDLHLRDAIFGDLLRQTYPLLAAHHDRFAAIPAIASYLSSPLRQQKVNGNALG